MGFFLNKLSPPLKIYGCNYQVIKGQLSRCAVMISGQPRRFSWIYRETGRQPGRFGRIHQGKVAFLPCSTNFCLKCNVSLRVRLSQVYADCCHVLTVQLSFDNFHMYSLKYCNGSIILMVHWWLKCVLKTMLLLIVWDHINIINSLHRIV